MKTISQLVKRRDWQRLRASFVGTWMHTPRENTAKLRAFLGQDLARPRSDRFRIVLNYLTGSGFRSGRISHPAPASLLKAMRSRKENS